MGCVGRNLVAVRAAVLTVLGASSAGCGRIAFDALADARGAHAGDGSGDSAAPTTCTSDLDCASQKCSVGGTCLTSCRTWSAFSAPQLVSAVTTAQDDVGPELSVDGLTLYVCTGSTVFVSTRVTRQDEFAGRVAAPGLTGSACDPTISGDGLELIYDGGSPMSSQRATSTSSWQASSATPGLATNTDGPWLSKDGLRVYTSAFTNNDDVVMASRTSRMGSFGTTAVVIGGTASDSYPSLTEDELTIAFSSNRGGGINDIWMATRDSTATAFGAPFAVPELNSAALEWDPALSADGDTIVFASRRNGSFDVFIATRVCLETN